MCCRSIVVALACVIMLVSPRAAASPAEIDAVLKAHVDKGEFSGVVRMTIGDKTVLDRGYGMANREWRIANTPDTKFRIGSITKQFTAAAIFRLQEQGKLNINDRLKTYLPDVPAAWADVTLYQILTHTSGIPDFFYVPGFDALKSQSVTPTDLIALVRDKQLGFAPGTKWNYSNTGYDLLGLIIEKLSGQRYTAYIEDNFIKPLGMNDTGYDDAASILPRRASGYVRNGAVVRNAGYIDVSVLYAAGGLHSTVGDLMIWEKALYGGHVLSAASLHTMTTPFIATDMPGGDYACGLFVQKIAGHTAIGHPGFIDGFNAEIVSIPDKQMIIVVLANISGPDPVLWASLLAKAALEETR
jgi:CubicO group peptidase (beta-lactamase class C family)